MVKFLIKLCSITILWIIIPLPSLLIRCCLKGAVEWTDTEMLVGGAFIPSNSFFLVPALLKFYFRLPKNVTPLWVSFSVSKMQKVISLFLTVIDQIQNVFCQKRTVLILWFWMLKCKNLFLIYHCVFLWFIL